MGKKKDEFIPGQESEDQFVKVLSLLTSWIKAGIVDIEIDSDGDVDFNCPSEMRDLLKTQIPDGLEHDNVVSIIESEIPALIMAGISENVKKWLTRRVPDEISDDSEKIDLMVKRAENAVKALLSKNMKERLLLRKATPSYVVESLRWNPSTYHLKTEKKEKADVPYISLEITFTKPRSGRVLILSPNERSIGMKRADYININLYLQKYDIEDLIKKLNKILEQTTRDG